MIWLIGAGPMAEEYAKVLLAMNLDMRVFGRSAASAETFTRKTGLPVTSGGLSQLAAVGRKHLPDAAIVAVSPDQLSETASFLLEHGVKSILIEKPGGLSYEDIRALCKQAKQARARLLIAYNRRFFASTLRAQEIIREDGGVTSFSFEITEWAHVIGKLNKDEDVLRSWFLANTTHVVDLAWHIGGFPTEISCYQAGSLSWHPASSRYTGAGVSESGSLFSYHGDWQGPGRWSLEFCTPSHRLIFKPMEELHVQKIGSVAISPIELNDHLDREFKPGIYLQTERFLANDTADFCSIDDQIKAWPIYEKMAGYASR